MLARPCRQHINLIHALRDQCRSQLASRLDHPRTDNRNGRKIEGEGQKSDARGVNAALLQLDERFAGLYAREGRPSIAPERLIRASLLQLLYSIRSERQLMERMEFDLLFRWFVGLGIDDPVWDHSVFSKNRDRPSAVSMNAPPL